MQTWPGYANEAYGAYGGGSQSIPGYDFNYPTNATAGPLGPSESASQYEPDGGYTMVRVSHIMSKDHPLIMLLSFEAESSIC